MGNCQTKLALDSLVARPAPAQSAHHPTLRPHCISPPQALDHLRHIGEGLRVLCGVLREALDTSIDGAEARNNVAIVPVGFHNDWSVYRVRSVATVYSAYFRCGFPRPFALVDS